VFKTLLGPVDHILAKAAHLLVVPTGPLTSLPFQVLVTSEPSSVSISQGELERYREVAWLAKRQATSVLPTVSSLSALRNLAVTSPAPQPLIGFADPVFQVAKEKPQSAADRKFTGLSKSAAGSKTAGPLPVADPAPDSQRRIRSYSSYFRGANTNVEALRATLAPLPETADELRAVAGHLGAELSQLKLGAEASETVVKSLDLSSYRVVYFATHGLVAGELASFGEPSLALTVPSVATGLDDGLLTASEIATLKLRADWVVLSACNTAAGDGAGADALSGLARSFFYAGARALLVTHWAVDSQAAVALTTRTFAELQRSPGIGRAEALRRSMLGLMHDASDPINAYPGLWAPFIVVGEGGRNSQR
jgi:CHAT domain-containing protein